MPSEGDAALRADLIGQLGGAQAELEANLSILMLSGDTAMVALAEAQLQVLSGLQRRVDQSNGADLQAMRGQVFAVTAAAQVAAQQARCSSTMSAALSLQEASEKTRKAVLGAVDDYYQKRIFDPYLRFESAEDEAEYRKRESERQTAIQKALAEGTPQGNLKAAQIMQDQLRDAGDHGADRSPDYAPMLARVAEPSDDLVTAIAERPVTVNKASADPLDAIAPSTKVVVSDVDQAGHGLALGLTSPGQARAT